jgi:hypothetical protein
MKIMAKNGAPVSRKGLYSLILTMAKVRMIDKEDFDTKSFLKRKRNPRRFLCGRVLMIFAPQSLHG